MTDIKELAKTLSLLTIQETLELTEELKNTYGLVSVQPQQVIVQEEKEEVEEEQVEFDVTLESVDEKQRLTAIKVWKGINGGGLVENKEIINSAPVKLRKKIAKMEAEDIKSRMERVGAKITIS